MNERDFDKMVREAEHPILSVFLNALDRLWQIGIVALILAWLLN